MVLTFAFKTHYNVKNDCVDPEPCIYSERDVGKYENEVKGERKRKKKVRGGKKESMRAVC